jgi:hypothetical protein
VVEFVESSVTSVPDRRAVGGSARLRRARRPFATTAFAVAAALGGTAPAVSTAAQAPNAQPGTCRALSPEHTVALVELFTSEGCSSCPPADRWLSSLVRRDPDYTRWIPLSLHVTYWDRLGWRDPWGDAHFTERQQRYAALHASPTVYTPQVVLDGVDYRRWDGRGFERDVDARNTRRAAARIALDASGQGASIVVSADERANVYIARFESGVSSRPDRGENAGERLAHDHVVRGLYGPFEVEGTGRPVTRTVRWEAPPPVPSAERRAPSPAATGPIRGVAAFVQTDRGRVLQATACRLP